MSIDLLVFGPHPDDIEIGLGGTIARHTAAGTSRRAVRSDRAASSRSNGTPDERQAEAAEAAARPRRRLAREPRLARRRHRADAGDHPLGRRHHPPPSSAHASRFRTGTIGIPITSPPATCCAPQCSRSGLRRYDTDAEPWRPDWICYYFINDSATPSFVVDVSAHYERKREALECYRSQFAPAGDGAVATRLTASTFRQLIESRDAQFGALAGVAFAEGIVVREPVQRAGLLKHVP